jgi:hypothetical protein
MKREDAGNVPMGIATGEEIMKHIVIKDIKAIILTQ